MIHPKAWPTPTPLPALAPHQPGSAKDQAPVLFVLITRLSLCGSLKHATAHEVWKNGHQATKKGCAEQRLVSTCRNNGGTIGEQKRAQGEVVLAPSTACSFVVRGPRQGASHPGCDHGGDTGSHHAGSQHHQTRDTHQIRVSTAAIVAHLQCSR